MSVLDFLGSILGNNQPGFATPQLPGLISGYGGGTFDMQGRQVTPRDGYAMPPRRDPLMGHGGIGGQQPEGGDPYGGAGFRQSQAPPPQRDSGIKRFLGGLGDALLAGSGGEPIYGPKQDRRKLGAQLTAYLGIDDPNLAAMMEDDPDTGFKLWQSRQPKQGEPFTLGAGQVRYGADNKEVARGPDSAAENDPTFIRELERLGIDPSSSLAREIFYAKNSPAGFMFKPSGGGQAPSGGVREGATATNPTTGEKVQYRSGQWVPAGGGAGNGTGGFPG